MIDRKSLLVINGHPDPGPHRFCAAISRALIGAALSRGWNPSQIDAGLFHRSASSREYLEACNLVERSKKLIVVFPLWLDSAPEPLRAFFDELAEMRSGAAEPCGPSIKSAHLIVTMAMPAFARRARAREDATNPGNRHAFAIAGVQAERLTFIGNADTMNDSQRRLWLERISETVSDRSSSWRRLAATARQIGEWPRINL